MALQLPNLPVIVSSYNPATYLLHNLLNLIVRVSISCWSQKGGFDDHNFQNTWTLHLEKAMEVLQRRLPRRVALWESRDFSLP